MRARTEEPCKKTKKKPKTKTEKNRIKINKKGEL